MKINNRRYIGCKTKLLRNIYDVVIENGFGNDSTFADIFAGTGAVGGYFADNGFNVIFNDTLYSNYIAYFAFYGNGVLDIKKINKKIEYFNSIDSNNLEDNYFSNVYGDKYFSKDDAKKIGFIRDTIEEEKSKLSQREYFYLITSLIYACDKIANTVGHFESYLKSKPCTKGIKLENLEIDCHNKIALIFNEDANTLVKKIKADIVYIDPPYNARQYVNFYHVIENLARWNKPTEFEGDSMKFKRDELKSDYCRKKAPILFSNLINDINAKLIIVSYNNTYKAGSISSVNTISSEQIIDILGKKGRVSVQEIDYKAFNSGKTELKGHKELLYICEVDKNE